MPAAPVVTTPIAIACDELDSVYDLAWDLHRVPERGWETGWAFDKDGMPIVYVKQKTEKGICITGEGKTFPEAAGKLVEKLAKELARVHARR